MDNKLTCKLLLLENETNKVFVKVFGETFNNFVLITSIESLSCLVRVGLACSCDSHQIVTNSTQKFRPTETSASISFICLFHNSMSTSNGKFSDSEYINLLSPEDRKFPLKSQFF